MAKIISVHGVVMHTGTSAKNVEDFETDLADRLPVDQKNCYINYLLETTQTKYSVPA